MVNHSWYCWGCYRRYLHTTYQDISINKYELKPSKSTRNSSSKKQDDNLKGLNVTFLTFCLDPMEFVPEEDKVSYVCLRFGEEAVTMKWLAATSTGEEIKCSLWAFKNFLKPHKSFNRACYYLLTEEQKLN